MQGEIQNMTPAGLSTVGSGGSIVWAILLIIFGFLAIALPFATSWGVVVVVAWLIVFSGAFQFIHAFQSHGVGHILWKLLVAVLYLIVGIYFLLHPILGIAAFTFWLAIFFVVEGIFDLVAYLKERGQPGARWILFDGIITLLLGLLVWRQWPSSSLWVIGTLVGISMIMTGTTRLMLGLSARRLAHS
jgi:uncharacterized membrane protein HdeD (DUF308 family)